MPNDDERHERVLHARIPESLERELKARARLLGMSVSNIVRSVLSSSLGLVEDIVLDSADIARAVAGERVAEGRRGRPRSQSAAAGVVIGWQDVRLALNAVCADCNAILPRGIAAAVAVYDRPGPQTVVCTTCRDRRIEPAPADTSERGDDHEKGRGAR